MEKQVNYKQTNRKLPYPRVEWKCQECGFLLCICEGYDMNYKSNDYGKLVYPTGKCMKCKGEIVVGKGLGESSGLHLQNVSGSFSDSDVKWVVYYGHTKDKRIFLDEEKSGLDYYLEDSFRRNETMKIFGEIFWNRIRKLVENYR